MAIQSILRPLCVLLLPSLSACSALQNMEDMKKTTENMAKTTEGMAGQIDLSVYLQTMIYQQGRQGGGAQARNQAYEHLVNSPDIFTKLDKANEYMVAFDYQLWADFGKDTRALLDNYRQSAVREFLTLVKRFIPADRIPDPTSSDNDMLTLYALVANLHKINPIRDNLNKTRGLPVESMMTLLRNGLAAGREEAYVKGEKPIEPYMTEVLREQENVVFLLKMRANFLPAIVLGRCTELSSKEWTKRWKAKIQVVRGKLESNLLGPEQNFKSLRYLNEVMEEEAKVLAVLEENGISPDLHADLVQAFQSLKIPRQGAVSPQWRSLSEQSARSSAMWDEIRQFDGHVTRLLQAAGAAR